MTTDGGWYVRQRPDAARAVRALPDRAARVAVAHVEARAAGKRLTADIRTMEHYANLLVKSIFLENMALAFFLGHVLVSRLLEEGRDRARTRRRGRVRPGADGAAQQPDPAPPAGRGRARLGAPGAGEGRPRLPGVHPVHQHDRGGDADRRDGGRPLRARGSTRRSACSCR